MHSLPSHENFPPAHFPPPLHSHLVLSRMENLPWSQGWIPALFRLSLDLCPDLSSGRWQGTQILLSMAGSCW